MSDPNTNAHLAEVDRCRDVLWRIEQDVDAPPESLEQARGWLRTAYARLGEHLLSKGESIPAQVQKVALEQLWAKLGVSDQTAACLRLDALLASEMEAVTVKSDRKVGAHILAHKVLGAHCGCYADAWPAETCEKECKAAQATILEHFETMQAFNLRSRLRIAARRSWAFVRFPRHIMFYLCALGAGLMIGTTKWPLAILLATVGAMFW